MRRLLSIFALAGVAWVAGLFVFMASLPKPAPADAHQADSLVAEAVVVYTGGAERIASAVTLLEQGAGQRLLISGVHPHATPEDLARLAASSSDQANNELFDCCIDLGREARTTIGNADEAARWVETHQFMSLVLVTSDYHMPRAMLETRQRLPNVAIEPYAVYSGVIGHNGQGKTRINDWGLLMGEYSKFLAARLRSILPARKASRETTNATTNNDDTTQ